MVHPVLAACDHRFEHADHARFADRDPEHVLFSRAKLEAYLESLESLQERQQRILDAADTLESLDPGGPDMRPAYRAVCPLDRMQVQSELATSALIGGLTNVAVIASGANGASQEMLYESLRPLFEQDPNFRDVVSRHTVCHEASTNPAFLNVVHAATRRHVEMIAGMARALDAVPEAHGTMLDYTAIVFLSDNGDEHHSVAKEWPVLIVGGSKLGLKTDGRALIYPAYEQASGRQMSNLFNTLGYAAGTSLDDFGLEASTRIERGPLSELFG